MSDISKIDKNFAVKEVDENGFKWYDSTEDVFSVFGLWQDEKGYFRVPDDVGEKTSNGVARLARHTCGGRIIFETNTSKIAIDVKGKQDKMAHFPLTGSIGLDIYLDEGNGFEYFMTFVPPFNCENGYKGEIPLRDDRFRKIMIHFPLYAEVNEFLIGVDEKAEIKKCNPYKNEKPVVYYGSSITQGGCVSRPGNHYPAIVSRKLMKDFVCLGFSGNAHGEQSMAEYIASLEMSAFVFDYDHNDMQTPDLLRERHYPFYKTVREKHKDIPIIFMSAPYSKRYDVEKERSRQVVLESYNKAKENGDNVYFIDGMKMFDGEYRDCATVDGVHPNDFGFVKMAEAVLKVMNEC